MHVSANIRSVMSFSECMYCGLPVKRAKNSKLMHSNAQAFWSVVLYSILFYLHLFLVCFDTFELASFLGLQSNVSLHITSYNHIIIM